MIDLSYLRFAEPSGLVLICSEAERLAAQGHVDFTSPRNSEVANYLARMRLHEVLNELGISHGLPRVRENGVGLGLLEIRRFSSTDAASKLAEHVHANLVSQNGDIAAAVYVGICEAGENVFRHLRVREVMLSRKQRIRADPFGLRLQTRALAFLRHFGIEALRRTLTLWSLRCRKGSVRTTMRGRATG